MILRDPSQYRTTPWKNGGGTTTEIAAFPPGSGLDEFAWRVSRAGVAGSGSFSIFPGIDRSLAVLSGGRLELTFEGGRRVTLSPGMQPYRFPADLPVDGAPLDGPILDLNVMTRRGRFRHAARRVEAKGRLMVVPDGVACLILPDRVCTIATPTERAMLAAGGAAILEAKLPDAVELIAPDPTIVFIIDLFRD